MKLINKSHLTILNKNKSINIGKCYGPWGTFSVKETGLTDEFKFSGGVAVGDKVVFAPVVSSKVGIYDVRLDSFSTKETGLTGALFWGVSRLVIKWCLLPISHRKWGFTMLH